MTAGGHNSTTGSGIDHYQVRTSADWLARRHGSSPECRVFVCTDHPPERCACGGDCPCHWRAIWKTELSET